MWMWNYSKEQEDINDHVKTNKKTFTRSETNSYFENIFIEQSELRPIYLNRSSQNKYEIYSVS